MQKILLLEDDRNLNRGISLKLEKEGYQVFSAFSAKEAEELFDAEGPDLIISDILLPPSPGPEERICSSAFMVSAFFPENRLTSIHRTAVKNL